MHSTYIYYALYNFIVETYESVERINEELYLPLNLPRRNESLEQATAKLIDLCKYQGKINQLISIVKDNSQDPERQKKLSKILFEEQSKMTIAVSVTRDIENKFKNRDYPNVKFIYYPSSVDDVRQYYLDLANNLDHCNAYISIIGNADICSAVIEHFYAISRGIPIKFLLPEGAEVQEIIKIASEVIEYENYENLDGIFNTLLNILRKPVDFGTTLPPKSDKFDVFLCHNSSDKPAVREIDLQLKNLGIRPWLDESETRPETTWRKVLEKQIANIGSVAVFVGREGIGPWQERDLREILDKFHKRGCRIIPVLLKDAPTKPKLPTYLQKKIWIDFRTKVPNPLEQLIMEIKGIPNHQQQAGITTELVPESKRDKVFISYSERDKKWLEKFKSMSKPLIRNEKLILWDDTQIVAGGKWKEEIKHALKTAKVGVLLVSQNFLDSDFIAKNELPPLLNASEEDGVTIFWIAVSHCLYEETEIKEYQAANDPSTPLNTLIPAKQQKALKQICQKIRDVM